MFKITKRWITVVLSIVYPLFHANSEVLYTDSFSDPCNFGFTEFNDSAIEKPAEDFFITSTKLDVTINAAVPCVAPSSISVSDLTPYTVNIGWTSNSSESLWNIELVNLTDGDTATGVATYSGVTVNPYSISGLSPETEYAVLIQADCGPLNTPPVSDWSTQQTFTTPPTCLPLGTVSIDSVSDTAVWLSWSQAGAETTWDIELINLSNTPPDTFTYIPNNDNLVTNTPNITGLTPESNYQFIVRADCGAIDGAGTWTTAYSFETLPSCIPPSDLELASFTNNQITFTWTSQDNETEWYVEIVNTSNSEVQTEIADDSTTINSYTATGLSGDSDYEIYISANCGSIDGTSAWTGPLSVTTACDPSNTPYFYDVETHATTTNSSIEDCWSSDPSGITNQFRWNVDGSGSTPSGSTGPSGGAFSGTNYFYVEASQGSLADTAHLYTQQIDLSTLTNPGLSFMYHMYGADMGTLFVDVFSNGVWHLNEFSISGQQQLVGTAPWLETNMNLASYSNIIQIRFRAVRGSGYRGDISLDDISIDEGLSCYAPNALTAVTIWSDSALVSWSDNNVTVPQGWLIEYGMSGFSIGSGTVVNAADTSFLITGLTPGEEYDFYVSANCSVGDTSTLSSSGSFTTLCAAFDSPYFYDVESQTVTTNSDLFLNCWTATPATGFSWDVDGNGSTPSSDTGPDEAFSGNKYYYTEASSGSEGDEAELISPEIDLTNLSVPFLQFRYHMFGEDMGTLHIDIFDGVWHTDEFTVTGQQQTNAEDQWIQAFIDLSAYSGVIQIRFRGERGGNYKGDISIDDIHIREQPNCFPPAITIDATTSNSVTATIDTIGTFGSTYHIEMIDLTSGGIPTGIPTDTVSTVTFTINSLNSGNDYEMFIRSNCGTEESEWTSISFQTKCAPIGDFFKDWEELSTGNDTANCWTYLVEASTTAARIYVSSSTGTLAHSPVNFLRMYNSSDLNPELILISPELNNITAGTNLFTFWARASSGTSPFEVGTISDIADPSTFSSLYAGSVGTTYDSISVPFISYTGTDTRIAIKFNPLTTYDYLFIDDVKWGPGPACALPIGFNAIDIDDEEVTLDWLEISQDTVWHLELVDVASGTSVYDSIPTDTAYAHPFVIDGLQENTIYDVYLSNPCLTNYSAIQTSFVTPWTNDIGVNAILSPISETCNLSDSTQIEVEITNYGGHYQTGFPVELSWDNTNYLNVGTFTDTLWPGDSTSFTIDGYYDFSTSIDSTFWVRTALGADSALTNNASSLSVTNLGNMYINVEINTGQYTGEIWWEILDTINDISVYNSGHPTGYVNNTTYNIPVCVYAGGDYVMNAWDTYDDGWNGGTYSITRCGGIILANNNGNEVTNGIGGITGDDLEAQEGFHVDLCPEDDLAVMSIDGLENGCGLGIETGTVTIMNFGNNDIAANGATAQYQFNNSGLWIDFWNFDTGLASQQDTVLTMPGVDMSITGQYTIEVQIIYAADEDTTTNYQMAGVTSIPTLTEDSTTFNSDNGGWTINIINGVNNSWEYGIPTTANIGTGNDQEVWATNLTGNAALNEQSYLLSPCYDFSTYTEGAEIVFDFVRTNTNHLLRLEYSINGGDSWINLWTPPSNTTNWTNQFLLEDDVAGESDVKFRWRFQSSFNTPIEGFGFDNWEVYEHVPYTDATLSDLTVNGNTVTDPVTFDPAVYDYNYEVPYGATDWDVNAIANAPFVAGVDIDEPATLPGTATVTVTAQDTMFTQIYTVNITETPPSTDATLSSLEVSNASVPGFNPDTLCYTVTFPNGSAFTPNVNAVTNEPNATYVINNTSIPGTATIVVTAQDGVTQNTYCIVYEEEQLGMDATLSDLTVDGVTISGFNPDTLSYTYEVPNGTTVVPTVGYTTTDLNATLNITNGTLPFPSSTTIEVTAEDGITMITYVVNFVEAAGTNSNLLDLTVNGGTVAGFDAATTLYNVELPFNSAIPTVVGLPEDNNANVEVTDATGVPGTTVIVVTAEDGVSTTTYYINWTYTAAATDATLATASVDFGALCPNFDPAIKEYTIVVPSDAVQIAILSFTANDPNATTTTLSSPNGPTSGSYVIQVTAEDGVTSETYTFTLTTEWCLGIDEELMEAIIISPNPSTGIFTITTSSSLTNYSIAIVDQLGKIVYESVIVDAIVEHTIDLKNLSSGVYNMRINTTNNQIVKRISIIK